MDKKEITELIQAYWKFDNNQQSISSWHDKQDLIKAIEALSHVETQTVDETQLKCENCEPANGFYLGMTCPKCSQPFRSIKPIIDNCVSNSELLERAKEPDYSMIYNMHDIEPNARKLAVVWGDNMVDFFITQKVKLASDIMNYAKWYSQLSKEEDAVGKCDNCGEGKPTICNKCYEIESKFRECY